MRIVYITALGVGGATVFGALIGAIFGKVSDRYTKIILSFSSGIMLSASVFGLIIPALESSIKHALVITFSGILCGAICMDLLERWAVKLYPQQPHHKKVMLFVAAIAIHNFPEGLAAGIGFGNGNIKNALLIAGGIALQNIPEGIVLIAPMLSTGMTKKKTLFLASCTGFIEIIGTLLGYSTILISATAMPFMLSFAGGSMLYIICGEMIPECCWDKASNYSLLTGFCIMLSFNYLL